MAVGTFVEVVSRTVGFGHEHEYVAEVTRQTLEGGLATVREYGHTAWGAMMRARSTAASRLTSRRRRAGFYEGGFEYLSGSTAATFRLGFA